MGFNMGDKLEKMERTSDQLKGPLSPQIYIFTLVIWEDVPEEVVDDLDPTEDGEASEEAHCAPYQTQLGLSCYLSMEY